MIAAARRAFNGEDPEARFERYGTRLRAHAGRAVGFRLAETPVFVEAALAERCAREACELASQLAEPARLDRMRASVPAPHAAHEGPPPQFLCVDFALATDAAGAVAPRLVELQGFPSLFAFQLAQGAAWAPELRDVPCDDGTGPYLSGGVPASTTGAANGAIGNAESNAWRYCFGGRAPAEAAAIVRAAVAGGHEPGDTVLVDLEPHLQKTAADFTLTAELAGVAIADPRSLTVRGGRVFRRDAAGRERRVRRIYNRVVGEDFARPEIAAALDPRLARDVEWAAHPAWFWLWSKASLPHLSHPAVPRTALLSELDAAPADLAERYVLKPLFAFAGAGVNVRPVAADLGRVPRGERAGWCIQERIAYAERLEAGDGGGVKVELRVLLARPDADAAFTPITSLCRLARGHMHGVDHNRDRTWVGSSIAFWPG